MVRRPFHPLGWRKPALSLVGAALLTATLPLNALKASADTPVVITQQCRLNHTDVHYGDTVEASGVLQNTGSTPVTLLEVVLAGRPPGGVNSGGPYADFAPEQQNVSLAAGEGRVFFASRTFGSPDPTGAGWRCYITFETTDSVYHDGTDAAFSVTSVVFTQQCSLSSTTVHAGDTVTATGSLQNAGDTAITLPNVVLAGRPPGGTNQGGPYDDFSPEWYDVELGAGQTQTFTATRTFTSSDPTGWRCYLTFQTPDGAYHDGTNTAFTVSALCQATVTEFPIPTPASQLSGIAAGPDGNLWFTERAANQIGRITPAGAVTEFAVPTPNSGLGEITTGPDGNLWFTEGVGKIGRFTPAGDIAITEFSTPTPSYPNHITAGPDGNVWFTDSYGFAKVARITPLGEITEFRIMLNKGLYGIASGSDGNLWFTIWGFGIGRITPAGQITYFGARGRSITAGPDGNLWFTQPQYQVGRMTPDGVVTFFGTPTGNNQIAAGPDGNLWFSETSNRIGRITPSGALTEFDLPSPNRGPDGITAGPDGNIWFVESSANQIGRLELPPP